jgi:cephalosporin-C deacetylase-like acetyl esterase
MAEDYAQKWLEKLKSIGKYEQDKYIQNVAPYVEGNRALKIIYSATKGERIGNAAWTYWYNLAKRFFRRSGLKYT